MAEARRGAPIRRGPSVRSVRGENLVEHGQGLDCVVSQYDAGYQGVSDAVTHQRAMIFVRDDFFLLFDRVLELPLPLGVFFE